MAGLMPCLALAQIKQERLGTDGFPADWGPGDFAIGKEIISKTTQAVTPVMVSGTLQASGTGVTKLVPANTTLLDRLGVLGLGSGGEAPDVWQKAGRPEAETGLERAVAQGVASPSLREGWRRLLLTSAEPPKVGDKGLRPSWLAVRAGTLQKMGLYEAAWSLWQNVPAEAPMDESVALGWVQAKLLAGQTQEACATAKSRALANSTGQWGAVMAVCQLVGNGQNPAAASLSLQVVEPMLRQQNPALLRILTAVQDGKPVTTLGGPSMMVDSLGGAILGAYPALVGTDILPRMPDVSLRRIMESEALPVELRGRAGVALARQTGLPADGAKAWQLVSGTAFTGAMPDAVVVARGTKDISGSMVGDYVQSALRLGMVDSAAKVMPLWLKQDGLNANESRERVQTQLVLQALQGKVNDRLWDDWLLAQPLEVQTGVRQAQRTLLVVEGLGIGVPGRVWQQMRDRAVPVSTVVDPAWQRLLAAAVRDNHIPGVMGLISEAWVGQPPAGVVPVVMGASIEALRRVGMDDIARRVAVEAMLGIPASHLIPLVAIQPEPVSGTAPQVLIGADSVSATVPVSSAAPIDESGVLIPPRVQPVAKPTISRPTVKIPVKPTAPKVAE